MDIFEAIFTRRSVRKFCSTPIDNADITLMLGAAMSAPTARHQRVWRFLLLQEQANKDKLADILQHAQMARHAPLAILVCADTAAETAHGYWVQDCSAAIENMMLTARGKGIGTVWTGIHPVPEREEAIHKAFALPENIRPLGAVIAGYPEDSPFEYINHYNEDFVHYERW